MKYKQCLLFVAKCLTLDNYQERTQQVREAINNKTVDWEDVVRLSSGQYVLPAFYLQLKRNGLLPELPADLMEYLKEITNLNRERNLAILNQAEGITSILNAHNISPIFLKGVAHLLGGLYNDIAERMIGDIDLLVQEDRMVEAADLLIHQGYKPLVEYTPNMFRELKHFPRLQNFNFPAAVEIHKEVIQPPHQKIFRGFELIQDKQQVTGWQGEAFIPSVQHLIIHNVFNAQINDKSFVYGDILLRQMYDLWLLSLKTDILSVAKNHNKKFNTFNSYFAAIGYIFSDPKGINYQDSSQTKFYLKRLDLFLSYLPISKIYTVIINLSFRIYRYIAILLLSIIQRETRELLIDRLSDRKWYGNHIRSYRLIFKH